MYVVHGVAYPYHENSTHWIVDCCNDKKMAYNLMKKLNSHLPSIDRMKRILTDNEKVILKNIHHRALPNGYYYNRYFDKTDGTIDNDVFGNDYFVKYFVSDLTSNNCIATSQLW